MGVFVYILWCTRSWYMKHSIRITLLGSFPWFWLVNSSIGWKHESVTQNCSYGHFVYILWCISRWCMQHRIHVKLLGLSPWERLVFQIFESFICVYSTKSLAQSLQKGALAAFFKLWDKDSLNYVIVYGHFPKPLSQAMCSRKAWCVKDCYIASHSHSVSTSTIVALANKVWKYNLYTLTTSEC
jgi:hypothetical protein